MTDTDPAPPPADTPPSPSPAPASSAPSENVFAIPDAYKDKAWASKIKSQDDVWKQLDNTQALVGKKIIVPDFEKADPKDIEEYVSQLRPKDKAAYKFSDDIPAEERTAYADMLHEIGIPAYQANKLTEKYLAIQKAQMEKAFDNNAFMEDMKKSFGENYKETFKQTSESLKSMLSEADHKLIDIEAPNLYSAAVYKITAKLQADYKKMATQLHEKYGVKEGGAGGETPPGEVGTVDKAAERKRIRGELDALPKKPHTDEDKQKLLDALSATYK